MFDERTNLFYTVNVPGNELLIFVKRSLIIAEKKKLVYIRLLNKSERRSVHSFGVRAF